MFLLLLLMDLAGLRFMAGRRNILRSVLVGVTPTSTASSKEVPTLRVVLRELGLGLASVVVSRVGGGEEIGISEVCLTGNIVNVYSSLQ